MCTAYGEQFILQVGAKSTIHLFAHAFSNGVPKSAGRCDSQRSPWAHQPHTANLTKDHLVACKPPFRVGGKHHRWVKCVSRTCATMATPPREKSACERRTSKDSTRPQQESTVSKTCQLTMCSTHLPTLGCDRALVLSSRHTNRTKQVRVAMVPARPPVNSKATASGKTWLG